MATAGNKEMALAHVYASAMIALALEQGEADNLLSELHELAGRLDDDPDFERFFASPIVDADARAASIEKIFRGRLSDLLVDSLGVLNRKGRLALFGAVVTAYRVAHQEACGRVEVHVKSAVPLNDELRERISETIGRYTGRETELVEEVDGELIGGLIVQIGDEKFDASVARSLERLGASLRRRASLEIHSGKSYVAEAG